MKETCQSVNGCVLNWAAEGGLGKWQGRRNWGVMPRYTIITCPPLLLEFKTHRTNAQDTRCLRRPSRRAEVFLLRGLLLLRSSSQQHPSHSTATHFQHPCKGTHACWPCPRRLGGLGLVHLLNNDIRKHRLCNRRRHYKPVKGRDYLCRGPPSVLPGTRTQVCEETTRNNVPSTNLPSVASRKPPTLHTTSSCCALG